jgi:hypothetical protein
MIILVSDTSILIDLERGGLLEAAFSCGMTLVVPDLLYERELADENGPYLKSLGLGVVSLSRGQPGTQRSIAAGLLRPELCHTAGSCIGHRRQTFEKRSVKPAWCCVWTALDARPYL